VVRTSPTYMVCPGCTLIRASPTAMRLSCVRIDPMARTSISISQSGSFPTRVLVLHIATEDSNSKGFHLQAPPFFFVEHDQFLLSHAITNLPHTLYKGTFYIDFFVFPFFLNQRKCQQQRSSVHCCLQQ